MSLDLLRARVAFRDRSFADVLDLSLRFSTSHAAIYARVAAVVLAAPCVLTIAAAQLFGWIAGWSIAILTGLAAEVPFTVLASRLVFQDDVSARAVLADALRDLPRLIGMRIVWLLGLALGSSCIMLPSLYVGGAMLYASEVMLLERAGLGTAIKRSHRIAGSALADAALGLLAATCLPLLAMGVAEIGGRLVLREVLLFRPPAPFWESGGSVLLVLGWFAVIPYATTARFFVYLNARTRAEGWDIQTRFAAIAARAEREVDTEQAA